MNYPWERYATMPTPTPLPMSARRGAPLTLLTLLALLFVSLAACSGTGDGRATSNAPPTAESTAAVPAAVDVTESGTVPHDAAHAPRQGAVRDAGGSGRSATVIAHPENIQPGLTAAHSLTHLANPRERDSRALEEGKQLFVSYNCSDCHGSEGSGAVGPSLQDGRWHFGGSAGEVFESIAEGRPNGMPAWGGRISDAQIWALVTYVRTLSAGKNVTTENFEGATVPRSGH